MVRRLHTASTIFWLINGFDKMPIVTANISCNGRSWPHIRKNDGHYVFLNMHDGKYRFHIECWGFNSKSYDVEIKNGNICEIFDQLYYNKKFKGLHNLRKIFLSLEHDGEKLKDRNVQIIINNYLPFLGTKDFSKDQKSKIKINGNYNYLFLKQKYMIDEKNFIFIDSYDGEYFILSDDSDFDDLKAESVLKPAWELLTDENGEIVLPIHPVFMSKNNIEIIVRSNDLESRVKINPGQQGETFLVNL